MIQAGVQAMVLAPLREDLRLHEAAPERDGSPSWSIQDPVTNRFFRIGWLEFECLLRWGQSPATIAATIAQTTPLAVDQEQVEEFGRFLEQHQLLRPTQEGIRRLAAKANEPGWRHWRWWLHRYLFVRIPLVRPDLWLARMLPLARALSSPLGTALIVLASLLGIVMVARQWDEFTHSVMDILTPSGILGFLLALAISKTFHELGHALVATHHGVRVSHMGVALVVLLPMLYTDTGESWKLRSSRQRLNISSAGVTVEIALAGLSTLAWALLDDGLLRQAALYLATTGWVLSLALNASPFMRFDGYFILTDLIDFPNLHERSSATGRAWLRRTVLGWDEPDPEPLSARARRWLVLFSILAFLYRIVIFLGIAVVVYLMFFKVLGIFLFVVEISWFIVRPIYSELSVWWKRRGETRFNRKLGIGMLTLFTLIGLLVPWAFNISAPAIAQPERRQAVFSPFPARLVALHAPGPVAMGTPLAQFEAPELQASGQRANALAQSLSQRLTGLMTEDDGTNLQAAASERLSEKISEARGIQGEIERLQVNADFAGFWLDVDPTLPPGTWINTSSQLGILVDPARWVADVYVEQTQVERIVFGAPARFWPENHVASIEAQVIGIDSTRSTRLQHPMLDATRGGPIATQPGERPLVPANVLYRVRLALLTPLPDIRETRGQASIEGTPKSLAWEAVKKALTLLIRESGF